MERNIITQILLSKDWPTKCFWCILSVSHTDCACEAKPENSHFQLKIQKVLHDLGHDVTNLVTALGMGKSWHFALTPEDADTGLGTCYHIPSLLYQGMNHTSTVIAPTRPEGTL